MTGGEEREGRAPRGADATTKEEVAATLERAAEMPNQTADEQAEEGPDAPGSRRERSPTRR